MSVASYKSILVNRTFGLVLEQFLSHIKKHALVGDEETVLLAVSGGLDSMVMLSLFMDAGFSMAVAHCNFKLRGDESDLDEQFVESTCKIFGIPFHSKSFETAEYAQENRLSIQMAARELRYSWFSELMGLHGYSKLATAHHVNDSMETVLLNWVHGNGLNGFLGIPVMAGSRVRPMLFATREQIENYAAEKKIVWREDRSNQTDDYARNLIRHQVIPRLKEINPSFDETFQRGLQKLNGDATILSAALRDWRNEYVRELPDKLTIQKKGLEKFSLRAHVLYDVLKEYGFNFDTCLQIEQAVYQAQPGTQFLSATHQVVIDRDTLQIVAHKNFWNETFIQKNDRKALLGSWQLLIVTDSIKVSDNTFIAVLDADQLTYPLRWRTWQEGDYFYPLGMDHRKKVSDFLIDRKVSVADKKSITVIESAGQIVWVVGERIDNRFKITPKTRQAVVFQLVPYFT